ncbi:hypothetical protein NPIL_584481 [Nephila pilipes]|uniref:DUF4817 domain-containing protein n=1 Tax=Nephila pilipes TaxID=299642 RepID=A0A8X6QCC0_NEPPI|nr:hypothetical protein NPIL_584481 [Nephila pilipes]
MNKYSTDVRVFIVLQMARCDENVKAVQRAWQEKFHNKNWPNKRSMVRLYAKFKRTGSVEDDKLWLQPLLLWSQMVQNRSLTTLSLPIRPDL